VRIAAGVRTPLSPAQRARDPLPPLQSSRSTAVRGARLIAFLLGAAAVHAGVVVGGLVIGGREPARREVVRQEVKIEVQEHKVVPPPPPVEKPPEPEKTAPPPPPKKIAKAPPPPKAAPEPPKGPPPRVVGLSMESTTEGGDGPAFAVGNTRAGETAERAAAPETVKPAPAASPVVAPVRKVSAVGNRVATSIPTQGVVRVRAKPKHKVDPPYPDLLRSQGIEADVKLLVHIDESGKVTEVEVTAPCPYPEMNEAARKAALASEYEPATRDGVPVTEIIPVTTRFRLEEAQ